MARLWKAYTAMLFIVVAVYFALPAGTGASLVYNVVGISCVTAILVGIALHRPEARMPWYLMAAGQAAWVAGDMMYAVEDHVTGSISSPAVSDLFYVGSYPVSGFGILLLIRAQHRSRDLAGLVDCLIVTVGIGLLSWAFVAGPILDDSTMSRAGVVVTLAYPVGDLVFLGLLVRLMIGQGAWTPSFRLLMGGTLTILAADTGFGLAPTDSLLVAALDFLWLASYVLWGAAALHPDMASLATPGTRGSRPFTRRRLAILSGVVILPVVLFAAEEMWDLGISLGALVIGAAALSLLVMARMACDIEEIRLAKRERDDLQEDVFRRATQDEVTGLPNRPAFVGLTGSILERSARNHTPVALVAIEVSGIGDIARQHGHSHGDQVLSRIAARMSEVVGPDDVVARIGPHQFGILFDRLRPATDLALVAQGLLDSCRAPLVVDGRHTSLSARAGVAVSSDRSVDPEAVLRAATLAIASAHGDGHVEFFDAALRAEVQLRDEIEAGLRVALRTGQLELHYQPFLALDTGALIGHEALVRWNRPGHGLLFPDSFVPIAEKSELICDLDRWVMREATCRLAGWRALDPERYGRLTVAVNVSGRSLVSATIVDDVSDALQSSGLDPSRLTLEITETVLVDSPRATAQMIALRRLGVSISIDDFGTGYTSIGQLGQLPANTIKVDRSLVTSRKSGARELLALIAQVGHASGLRVLAEGIETSEQLATVTDLHYDEGQGYLIGRPHAAGVGHPSTALLDRDLAR